MSSTKMPSRSVARAKAPDYSFRVGGTRRFFVEAKKPSVNVKDDVTRRLPASALRMVGEAAAVDPYRLRRVRRLRLPDKAGAQRQGVASLALLTCGSTSTSSAGAKSNRSSAKDAVYKGSFDRFAADTKSKRGTTEVDTRFLADIEAWRVSLAKSITKANKAAHLNPIESQLCRAGDDRSSRLPADLRRPRPRRVRLASNAVAGSDLYAALFMMFRDADARYNSGLFHFPPRRGATRHPTI